jgi:hypothetical protein
MNIMTVKQIITDAEYDGIPEAEAPLRRPHIKQFPAKDCENRNDVKDALDLYHKSNCKYNWLLGKLDTSVASLDEGRQLVANFSSAKIIYSGAKMEMKVATLRNKLAQSEFAANVTPETTEERDVASKDLVDTIEAYNVAKVNYEAAKDLSDNMSPSLLDREAEVASLTKRERAVYFRADDLWNAFRNLERDCEQSDCGGPKIQLIQIARGDTEPQTGDLAHGELGYSTYKNDRGVVETHLWVGTVDGQVEKLYARGDKDTPFSLAKLQDDLQSEMSSADASLLAEINDVRSSVGDDKLDSISEIVEKLGDLEFTDGSIITAMNAAITAARQEIARVRLEGEKAVERLTDQHNFEVNCLQANMQTFDGGSW